MSGYMFVCDCGVVHYNDFTWMSWCLKSLTTRLFIHQLLQANNKENKAMHYWLFVREIHQGLVDSHHKWPIMQRASSWCHQALRIYLWLCVCLRLLSVKVAGLWVCVCISRLLIHCKSIAYSCSGVGALKSGNSSVKEIFNLVKLPVKYFESTSYLTVVTTDMLQWHRSDMKVTFRSCQPFS